MAKSKNKPGTVKKMIWQVCGSSALGGYVIADEAGRVPGAAAQGSAAAGSRLSWKLSSVELRDGLQVSEQPMDALPGELLHEFFKR